MNSPHTSTEFHPRWYRRRVSAYWWLERGSYLRFILRELSSVFIAYTVVLILATVYAVGQGKEAYDVFMDLLKKPLFLVLNAIALFFVVYHAVTWFNLAPKALVVRMGGKPVPPAAIAGGNYLAWLVVSVVLFWFLLGEGGAMKGKTLEPLLWTMFSAGGVVAALVLPMYLFLFGIAFPLGWLTPPSLKEIHDLFGNFLTRGVLLVVCTLPLFHAAHRFRYTLYDGLQVKHLNDVINPLCYGAAVVGSILAVWLVLTFVEKGGVPMFELKPLHPDAIPKALQKAERYRLLNEPEEAESICLDVLAVDPNNQEARTTLLLALTDQLRTDGCAECYAHARELLAGFPGEYERNYYAGIIYERRGSAQLERSGPGGRRNAYEWLHQAMACYERAEAVRPPQNDDALLRWNTCARMIHKHGLKPTEVESYEPSLLEWLGQDSKLQRELAGWSVEDQFAFQEHVEADQDVHTRGRGGHLDDEQLRVGKDDPAGGVRVVDTEADFVQGDPGRSCEGMGRSGRECSKGKLPKYGCRDAGHVGACIQHTAGANRREDW